MPPRIVVSGLGFVTCIGNSARQVVASVREQTSGLRSKRFYDNDALPVKVVGEPAEFEFPTANWRHWTIPARYGLDSSLLRALPPHGAYAACAVKDAIADARLSADLLADGQTGLYCASAGSPAMMFEHLDQLRRSRGERANPLGVVSSVAGTLNFNIGSWLGIRGSNCGYASACASASHAIGYAFDDLFLGRQQRALVVAGEDATGETLMPFAAMRALSTNPDPSAASRPFDVARDGFVGAGGGVAIVLETLESATARGAPIYAELAGWAQASDGYHPATPRPDGDGLAQAMRLSLRAAGIAPEQVGYICAHATSTPAGDKAEVAAIRSVFAPRLAELPVSSIKGIAGHALSMAGALEAAVCCLALAEGFIPGNANLESVDPACADLRLPRACENALPSWVLSNSSGFGGSNVCHVFKRFHPDNA